jgi:hypothetical protein
LTNRILPRLAGVALTVTIAGCSLVQPNLLGGREKCWGESDPRMATLMKGRLDLAPGSGGGTLVTPEGTDFETQFPFMTVESGIDPPVLVDGGRTVSISGETVTVFGGLGSDGFDRRLRNRGAPAGLGDQRGFLDVDHPCVEHLLVDLQVVDHGERGHDRIADDLVRRVSVLHL